MKKYMIVMAAFLLTAGMVNAQTTKKTAHNPTTKVSKPTSTKNVTTSDYSRKPHYFRYREKDRHFHSNEKKTSP